MSHRIFRCALETILLKLYYDSFLGVGEELERSPAEEDPPKPEKQTEEPHDRALVGSVQSTVISEGVQRRVICSISSLFRSLVHASPTIDDRNARICMSL
jgi:hypothetical protein